MKNLFGYLTAAVLAAITYVLTQYGRQFSALVDMIYPYVIRTLEGALAEWSGRVPFLLWQLLAVALGVVVLTTLVVTLVLKKNLLRWFGWVLAALSLVLLLHTLVYGMNYYAGDLADDLRMEVTGYSLSELVDATEYYRDQANSLAARMERDGTGGLITEDFETLANRAATGFRYLTYQRFFPVFAGSTYPVKRLGWENLYTAMGITGFTFPLTGEAAVNPQIPGMMLPFTICHEMAHRMCIANERDANFAGFLACSFNSNRQFQYSAYFMAYHYCYTTLSTLTNPNAAAAAVRLDQGVNDYLRRDMEEYQDFFRRNGNGAIAGLGRTISDNYLQIYGQRTSVRSNAPICDLLVNWHIQEVVLPAIEVVEDQFDPYDETQVDLTGIVNARGY